MRFQRRIVRVSDTPRTAIIYTRSRKPSLNEHTTGRRGYDFPVAMAALKEIIHAQHPGVRPQKATSRRICPASAACTRTLTRLNHDAVLISIGYRP